MLKEDDVKFFIKFLDFLRGTFGRIVTQIRYILSNWNEIIDIIFLKYQTIHTGSKLFKNLKDNTTTVNLLEVQFYATKIEKEKSIVAQNVVFVLSITILYY